MRCSRKLRILAALLFGAGLFAFLPGCHPAPAPHALTVHDGGQAQDAKGKPRPAVPGSFFAPVPVENGHNWRVRTLVQKWTRYRNAHEVRLAEARGEHPDAVAVSEGNVLCTAGITRMLNLLTGAGGQALDNTHCRLGVGDGTTAAAAGDTDLAAASGSSHRWFQVMDATYPSVSTNVATFKATVGTGDGNFHWQEFGIDAGTSNGTTVTAPLLNHKISDLGTKSSGSWSLTVTITIS